MTTKCYDASCPYHDSNHEDPDDGPFCHEPFCKKALLEKIEPELIRLEDGFYYWYPQRKGALSADDLRFVADVLDERNRPWMDHLKEYLLGGSERAKEELKEAIKAGDSAK